MTNEMTSRNLSRKKELETLMFASRSEIAEVLGKIWKGVFVASPKVETIKSEEIAEFLHLSAIGHNAFFRYTTLYRLADYFRTGKLYLSRLSEMNDLTEYINSEKADRTYLACFSFGSKENMAMWRLYGGGQEESVRLEFPGKAVFESIGEQDRHKVYKVNTYEEVTDDEIIKDEIEKWSFHDVAYQYGKALLWNRWIVGPGRCRSLMNLPVIPELFTCIKDYGWMSEKEVRLVITLKKAVPGLKRIAVDFDEPIRNMNILLGPSCSKQTQLKRLLDNQCTPFDANRVKESRYEIRFD